MLPPSPGCRKSAAQRVPGVCVSSCRHSSGTGSNPGLLDAVLTPCLSGGAGSPVKPFTFLFGGFFPYETPPSEICTACGTVQTPMGAAYRRPCVPSIRCSRGAVLLRACSRAGWLLHPGSTAPGPGMAFSKRQLADERFPQPSGSPACTSFPDVLQARTP